MDGKELMKPLVIYHGNCADGFTAAWVVWKLHPDWEFYPGKYQENPPDVTGRDVYFLDFSYKHPVILEMAKTASFIHILDHHKSAEADLVDLPENVSVKFDMESSGAHLAWNYFHPEATVKDRPMLIDYVEDRDLWKFIFPETKALSSYIFSLPYDFFTWTSVAEGLDCVETRKECELQGEAILRKQTKDIDELLQNKFTIYLGGHLVPTANLPYTLCTEAGNILAKGEPFASTFYLDGASAIFSLRSDEDGLDVSEIAKLYGGGGHKHAAGFKVPFYFAHALEEIV
jgi:oligoribonuclease NrnB/cAMP/cGMP phosphodiesterase (DHH superfamily)